MLPRCQGLALYAIHMPYGCKLRGWCIDLVMQSLLILYCMYNSLDLDAL